MDEALDAINGAWRGVDGRFYELPSRRHLSAGEATHDYVRQTKQLAVAAGLAANENPAVALNAARALRRRAELLEHEAVMRARSMGWSWREIASVLGGSASALHRRHSR